MVTIQDRLKDILIRIMINEYKHPLLVHEILHCVLADDGILKSYISQNFKMKMRYLNKSA